MNLHFMFILQNVCIFYAHEPRTESHLFLYRTKFASPFVRSELPSLCSFPKRNPVDQQIRIRLCPLKGPCTPRSRTKEKKKTVNTHCSCSSVQILDSRNNHLLLQIQSRITVRRYSATRISILS